jgi:hypothetical protein
MRLEFWPDVLGNFALGFRILCARQRCQSSAAGIPRSHGSCRAPRRWPPTAGRAGRADACPERTPCSSRCPPWSPAPDATAPSCRPPGSPGGQHRLARLTQMQALGNAVDKQVNNREFRQITGGKRLVLRPQPLGDLADRRAATGYVPRHRQTPPRCHASTARAHTSPPPEPPAPRCGPAPPPRSASETARPGRRSAVRCTR